MAQCDTAVHGGSFGSDLGQLRRGAPSHLFFCMHRSQDVKLNRPLAPSGSLQTLEGHKLRQLSTVDHVRSRRWASLQTHRRNMRQIPSRSTCHPAILPPASKIEGTFDPCQHQHLARIGFLFDLHSGGASKTQCSICDASLRTQ